MTLRELKIFIATWHVHTMQFYIQIWYHLEANDLIFYNQGQNIGNGCLLLLKVLILDLEKVL